ncbi:hypothetical protein JOM56_010460 [Amanita muscaria]
MSTTETPCLRYPESLGMQREISIEFAVNMLTRGINMAQTVPFSWEYVDKPADGALLLLFIPPQNPYPNDGIRYLEAEAKYTVPVGPPNTRELEVCEQKFGFLPGGQETMASRIRRRFRFIKGGPSQLVLVHYTRSQAIPIPASILNQAVRPYPLPMINQPPVFVLGEKAGQKAFPPGAAPMHGGGPPGGGQPMPPGMMPFSPQAMVAQQNANMELIERRREREQRAREAAVPVSRRPRAEDDDSADESEQISTRSLATTRYRRNHELMSEVFMYAAFGDKVKSESLSKAPYSVFDKTELESKIVRCPFCSV